jgi:BirA family biotin operon repressor/biotin-[acetyl-CoA-carboxylase] ligase
MLHGSYKQLTKPVYDLLMMQTFEEFHLPRVTSTNDYARELLTTHNAVLVTAQHQTAGRGRNGKTWVGDHGANIYASFGIKHKHPLIAEELASFMGRGALSVYDALRASAPGLSLRLKYPNDVLVFDGDGWCKISGILVEHEFHGSTCVSTVVGIGVNVEQEVFPDTIAQRCTSLRRLDITIAIEYLLAQIRDRFVQYLAAPWQEMHDRWVEALQLDSVRMTLIDEEAPYTPLRILADGRLIVRNDHTQQERIITDGDTLRYQH